MTEVVVREARMLAPYQTPYELHQWLWGYFEGDRDERPFLFRADEVGEEWLVHVRMPESVDMTLKAEPVTYSVTEGARYRFSLKAVPVRRQRHKVVEVLTDEAAVPWLEQRAEVAGFRILQLEDVLSQPLVFHGKKRRRITLNDTLFEGVLEVLDTEKFEETLTRGLGKHKGFGFGMLQLFDEV